MTRGITGFLRDGVPAHWDVYFGADDTDAALAKSTELGRSVRQPAEDTPYGRLAVAADPTGAQFRLVAPNDPMPANTPQTPSTRVGAQSASHGPPGLLGRDLEE